jgi:hypothetical protein
LRWKHRKFFGERGKFVTTKLRPPAAFEKGHKKRGMAGVAGLEPRFLAMRFCPKRLKSRMFRQITHFTKIASPKGNTLFPKTIFQEFSGKSKTLAQRSLALTGRGSDKEVACSPLACYGHRFHYAGG